jgi:hypothetical protein
LGDKIRGTVSNGNALSFSRTPKKYIPHTFQVRPITMNHARTDTNYALKKLGRCGAIF